MSDQNSGQPQPPENQMDEDAIAFAQGLFELARKGAAGLLVPLLDAGVPVDIRTSNGETLLMLAAAGNHADTVQLLLEKGANPEATDVDGTTALGHARAAGAQDTIAKLSQ
ncbi:ankyrin repeat domain-containing protein [Marinobacter sp. M216]|uniref:Ankyrin repeat domain-containing protein n=1 Tax=Marinobacter albus TaxID=3030833 RepID=A0ABT7HDL7_9GAMM|nr:MULTISPECIES: ankyrin repeat domain-containing protein [unclassified Marinobacter]MBW7471878.1 ankyrin repeat domain-containing protein [Marinobacter sp. F4218]MDK9558448.1 ankyrin repeat domain-containing protein [Marinobacter sp. M216]